MKKLLDAVAAAGRAFKQRYNDQGEEIPDPRPIEVPLAFRRPPDLHELVARAVRTEHFKARMAEQGFESEEEANDFDVDQDDPDDQLARAEVAMQMAEDMPKHKEQLLQSERAIQAARAEARRNPPQGRPVSRAEDAVKPGSKVILSEDE